MQAKRRIVREWNTENNLIAEVKEIRTNTERVNGYQMKNKHTMGCKHGEKQSTINTVIVELNQTSNPSIS